MLCTRAGASCKNHIARVLGDASFVLISGIVILCDNLCNPSVHPYIASIGSLSRCSSLSLVTMDNAMLE